MAFSTNGTSASNGLSSAINVTPLIDVLLVMLIIFMVIVPVMPRGLNSALPAVSPAGVGDEAADRAVLVQVEQGQLTFGHARTLLALESPEAILKAAKKVTALSMSVRQTETYVQGLLNPEKKEPAKAEVPLDPNVKEAQDRLQRSLGLKVRVEDKNGRGKVIIEYARLEDFDALMEAITGK